MTPETININLTALAAVIAICGFMYGMLRGIHNDIANLRERMARLEGLFEGFIKQPHE